MPTATATAPASFVDSFIKTHAGATGEKLTIIDHIEAEQTAKQREAVQRYRVLLHKSQPTVEEKAELLDLLATLHPNLKPGERLAQAREDAALVTMLLDHEAQAAGKAEAERAYTDASQAIAQFNAESDRIMLERRRLQEPLHAALQTAAAKLGGVTNHERRVRELRRSRPDLFA